jgi:hypothetical protein
MVPAFSSVYFSILSRIEQTWVADNGRNVLAVNGELPSRLSVKTEKLYRVSGVNYSFRSCCLIQKCYRRIVRIST